MKFTLPRGFGLASLLAFAFATVLPVIVFVRPAAAEGASIGLYSDAAGNTCSFSGDAPGLVTAYVVYRPDWNGFRGVQFAAPIPACFGATYVGETVPPGFMTIGSSQTGVSVAAPGCYGEPVNLMQITYFRSGGTAVCCEYPIEADPTLGSIRASDCAFHGITPTTVSSRFNADASCACTGNSPPFPPHLPDPADQVPDASVRSILSWTTSDFDDNITEYDVYLGTAPSPPLVASALTEPTYTPAQLAPLTQYFWRVVVRDALGLEETGPTWTFTTRVVNSPPYPPSHPVPADGITDVLINTTLKWVGGDIDLDTLTFDVYFGTSSPPPLLVPGLTDPQRIVKGLSFSTRYYWRVVSTDPFGEEASSPEWSFVTRPPNYPPNAPSQPDPANDATGQPVTKTLAWFAFDRDVGDTLVFDVYHGTSPIPPLLASDVETPNFTPPGLTFLTQYYWKIVVRDESGAEASGPVWTYTTRPENFPPEVPYSPIPPNGAVNRTENSTLHWLCGDRDGHAITYDVYFGTASPPPLVASDVATNSYTPGLMAVLTTYRWRIVARDQLGATTEGPLWTFTTRANLPPNPPSSPSPSNGAVNRPVNATLAWQGTDPNGHAVTYDVYFGTSILPPLVATNVAVKAYEPGPLAFATTYRWQIVARDVFGLERTGPTWSFTTKTDTAPNAPSSPNPANHGVAGQAPVLTWNATESDGQPLTFDVYFGTTSPPPLAASGLTVRSFEPGALSLGQYFWRVVASDGLLSTSGATWDFRVAQMGDVNLDGIVTAEDASCALGAYVYSGPCTMGGPLADVDCSGMVTPADARCIHKHVVDGSCAFCEGPGPSAPGGVTVPVLSVNSTWEWNDTLYVRLSVSGVPLLRSFGFLVNSRAEKMIAVRRGATNNFVALRNSSFNGFGLVGGYSLSDAAASSPVEFIDLRFYSSYWYDRYVVITDFVDDLAGASPFGFYLGGGSIPVLITRFDAEAVDGGVEVRWELRSDEAVESFTLYRREEGAALPVEVAHGPAGGSSQSYLDTSVEGGKTYHYELLIRAVAGGEFRSQIATVSTGAFVLSLGQNQPNPFNPQTIIPYDLPHSMRQERVRLWIIDISGRIVATLVDEEQGGGSYRVTWQGRDDRGEAVSSGVYFYVLDVGGERRTKKLVLLK